MIGYYVHHLGAGHLQHARVLARHAPAPVTGLSSLARPTDWEGDWVHLPRDDAGGGGGDADAGGFLHWAPLHDDGLRHRMASVASWIARAAPDVLVADVSVEVALLARLHGVPVVSVVLPGHRVDPPHRLGYGVATELVAPWPAGARTMVHGLRGRDARRLRHLGALSRFTPLEAPSPRGTGRHVVLLCGAGGGHPTAEQVETARAQTPGWEWSVLGGANGAWVDDPFTVLCRADVVVAQAGLGAVADIAAARRPAVLVPASRPHDEQLATATVLRCSDWPAVVEERWPAEGWAERLDRAGRLDGSAWSDWNDGRGGERFAAVVERAAASR